jgi:hypothetical protein
VYSRDCPKLKEERKIMEIKTLEKLPYTEARKKYRQQIAPTFSRSFAAIAATPIKKCTTSTQTEADESTDKNKTVSKEVLAKPGKALKPAKTITTKVGSPKKTPPKTTGPASKRREKTPSPGPATNKSGPEESMEEDEIFSESEVLRIREKGRKHRIRR